MGKRIIQQARGHGSLTYQAKKSTFIYRIGYPRAKGKAKVVKLISSSSHTAPLAKIYIGKEIFYNPATEKMFEGQEIEIGGEAKEGNILELGKIPSGTRIYNIEANPRDGGRYIRTGGSSATVLGEAGKKIKVLLPSKEEKEFHKKCKATIGVIAGAGRLDKPFLKAGRKHYLMKARNKLWPRTSAVKMNVIDHPFGSGRGKNVSHGTKGKIPKLNAPPGAKVGLLYPRRTGRGGKK